MLRSTDKNLHPVYDLNPHLQDQETTNMPYIFGLGRHILTFIIGFIGFLIAPGAGNLLALDSLRIGINPWPGYGHLILALEKGFYKKLGLNLKLVEYKSLTDAANAYQRKQIDGLATSAVDLYFANRRNPKRRMQIVLVTDYSNGADQIIGRKDHAKEKPLKGLRIGVEPDSLGVFFLNRILEKENLTMNDVRSFPMDQSKLEAAMTRNEIDAAVTYPPVSREIAKLPETKTLYTSADIPGEIIDIVAINQEWIKSHETETRLLVAGYIEALEYAQNNPSESLKIMALEAGLSIDNIKESLKGIKFATPESWKEKIFAKETLISTLHKIQQTFSDPGKPNQFWNVDEILKPALQLQGKLLP